MPLLPHGSYLTQIALQAFQNLLNLHILFCPPRDSEVEDPPRTLLSLTLDEEVQIRCAALVQAEIERFTEEVAERDEADRSGDEGASGDDDVAPRKGTRRRNAKALNGTKDIGAAVLAGTSIIRFRVWTWAVIALPPRQTNYTHPTRTRVCLHGHHLNVFAGYPRWGHSPKSQRRSPHSPWPIRRGVRPLFKDCCRCSPRRGHV